MIPTLYMLIDSFALTSSGKRDRKQLPAPQFDRQIITHEYVAPTTELEQFISRQLGVLVNKTDIGIDDNFFDLGATSLDIVKLAGELSSHLGTEVSAVDLFNHASIRQLSNFIQLPTEKIKRSEKQTKQLSQAKSRLKNRRKRSTK